jgi:hypothetical protein
MFFHYSINIVFSVVFLCNKHSGYTTANNADDVTFIQLDTPVDISGHYIRTACLPEQAQLWTITDECYVSGWGYTQSKNVLQCFSYNSILATTSYFSQ